ncbi:hypothetical protein GQ55_6G179400 [Panicum hallii var. hallii]|uniref:DC1 domain-containing protein n=1 Tax=Panicum hallii var. hallii TaxID=1504633 RepID=A0A2T7D726_9POAL|nr:hypothetical protein GQ55_6G179400 [Panicum hallii var. hallii]PUZ51371.1 hypothetical protein GQ55_6G179400 [Panicum hallii var. hallii]
MTRLFEHPPPEILHSSHPAHNLTLVNSDNAPPFRCNGCMEPGCGPRYTYDQGGAGESFDLHTCCALAEEEPTIKHPLFRNLKFTFLVEPTPPVQGRLCDACGDPARGFVYHCSKEDLDLHPCCASLPERILQDGRLFKLQRKASRPCGLCGNNGGRFWAYRSYFDGKAVDLHVACMKEMARLSWNAALENRVGGAQIVRPSEASIESMLESLPANTQSSHGFDQFRRIATSVAGGIISVISGNPAALITAVVGGVLQ